MSSLSRCPLPSRHPPNLLEGALALLVHRRRTHLRTRARGTEGKLRPAYAEAAARAGRIFACGSCSSGVLARALPTRCWDLACLRAGEQEQKRLSFLSKVDEDENCMPPWEGGAKQKEMLASPPSSLRVKML